MNMILYKPFFFGKTGLVTDTKDALYIPNSLFTPRLQCPPFTILLYYTLYYITALHTSWNNFLSNTNLVRTLSQKDHYSIVK